MNELLLSRLRGVQQSGISDLNLRILAGMAADEIERLQKLPQYVPSESTKRDAARYEWLRTFINFAVTNDRLNSTGFPTLDHAVDYGMLAHDERDISPCSTNTPEDSKRG